MRVLVTRPQPEAAQTAARLCRSGHTPTVAPLMDVEPIAVAAEALAGADGLIVSSPRAVPALAAAPRDLPVFSAGSRTAEDLRVAGFSRVESGNGDWQALARTITRSRQLRRGAQLLHVGGERVRGSLPQTLAAAGLGYRRVTAYRMVDCGSLPEAARHWLAAGDGGSLPEAARHWLPAGDGGAILFFSPATSALWYQSVAAYRDALRRHAAVCISADCAAALGDLAWASCRIAARPDEASVLAALETLS